MIVRTAKSCKQSPDRGAVSFVVQQKTATGFSSKRCVSLDLCDVDRTSHVSALMIALLSYTIYRGWQRYLCFAAKETGSWLIFKKNTFRFILTGSHAKANWPAPSCCRDVQQFWSRRTPDQDTTIFSIYSQQWLKWNMSNWMHLFVLNYCNSYDSRTGGLNALCA